MTENLIDEHLNTPLIPTRAIDRYNLGMQWLIWLGIFAGCFFVAQIISSVIILSYYKSVDIRQIANHPDDLNVLRYAQMLASVFGFLLPALLFSKLKDKRVLYYSYADKGFTWLFWVLIPLLLMAIYPMIDISFFLNKWMPWNNWYASFQDEYKNIVEGLLKENSASVFVLNFITIALLPAVTEEWIFRGTLQRLLSERLNVHISVLLASVFFSFIHFEFSGFLPRIVLGMFLGYLYYYSGSLWASIWAHVVNNGTQVVFMYLNNRGIYKINIDQPEMPAVWELIVYTAAFVVLWYLFYHFSQKRKSSTFV
jgi:membrane protease YdiL (CAAX protease family)